MKKILGTILLISSLSGYLTAQGNENPLKGQDQMVLENERIVDIMESDKPPLPYPNRKLDNPEPSKLSFLSKEFRFESKPEMPEVKPIAYETPKKSNSPKQDKLGRNYAKIALGQYLTPMAKIHLVNKEKSDFLYGIDFTHLSSHADYDLPFRQFREDYATINIGKINKNNRWNAELFLNNTAYNQYANFTKTDKNKTIKDSLARSYTNIDEIIRISSFFDKEKKWAYSAKAGMNNVFETNYIGTAIGNREHTFFVSPDINYQINEPFTAAIQTDIAFSNAKIADAIENRFFLNVTPFATYQKNALKAKLGVTVNYFNRSSTNDFFKFYAFPIAELQYSIKPEAIYVFAGLSSGMKNNTFENLLNECRYLNRNVNIIPSLEKANIYLGTNANLGSKLDVNLRVYYKSIQNMLLYVGSDSNGFIRAAYAPNTQNIGTKLSLLYNIQTNLKIGLTLEYNNYKVTGIAAAFGKPSFQTTLFSEIALIKNKLNILPQLYLYGKTPVALNGGTVIYRPFTTDFTLKADYQFSKRMSFFIVGNNLLGSKYYRYYNFYERRFNFLGGISIIF